MKKIIRNFLKYFILGALLFWPPVHMALSKKGIINSWKFSGWGMYASTSPKRLNIKILYLLKGINQIPKAKLSLGENQDLFVINPKGFYKLPSLGITTSELYELKLHSKYIRTLTNSHSAKKFIDMKRDIIEKKTGKSFPTAIMFVSETRLDPVKRFSFVNTKVYLNKYDTVQYLGNFKGTEYSRNELIDFLNKKLTVPVKNLVSLSKD